MTTLHAGMVYPALNLVSPNLHECNLSCDITFDLLTLKTYSLAPVKIFTWRKRITGAVTLKYNEKVLRHMVLS